MMDLPYLIRRANCEHGHLPAVRTNSDESTLAEIVDRAERLANSFQAVGVPEGAAVGLLSENRREYPEVDLGIVLGRRVRVALNSRLQLDDFRYALADCEAKALIHSEAFADDARILADELGLELIPLDGDESPFSYRRLLREAEPTPVVRGGSDEDPAWISYTSGTTGRPKGVILSHRAVREVAFNLLAELGRPEAGEFIVLIQPLSHGAGYLVLPQLLAGGGIYIMDRFDPEEALAIGRRPDTTTLKVVPAMFQALLAAHGEGRRLGYDSVIYGASPVPGPILDEALDRFGPVLLQVYGQTEAPVTLTCLHKSDHVRSGDHRRSAGRPWGSVEVEVHDEEGHRLGTGETGEVAVRGRHMMSGYLGLPDETAAVLRDGWLRTKDMGMIDERGYVHLLGRSDEMINSGGFNVAPREVEAIVQQHPAIVECVAFGVPDDRWGEAIHAAVRAREGMDLDADGLRDFVQPRLSIRTPKRFHFVGEVPKNAYGKTDRSQLMGLATAPGTAE
jgi:fatty-acyl-CoA synthase